MTPGMSLENGKQHPSANTRNRFGFQWPWKEAPEPRNAAVAGLDASGTVILEMQQWLGWMQRVQLSS